jgi:hypothetical protein
MEVFMPDTESPTVPPDPVDEAERKRKEQAGSEVEDLDRTPGDGTLSDAMPAGLDAEQMRNRSRQGGSQSGTG